MPEPRTGETGSSSSPGLLPTPRAIDGRPKGNGPRPDTLTGLLTYDDSRERILLPTPAAADGERCSDTYMRGNPTLSSAARQLLPTPNASDWKGGNIPVGRRRGDGRVRGPGDADLPAAVDLLLKTPTAQLAVNGGSQHPAKRRAGGHGPTLADQVEHELLPTPLAGDAKGTRNATASRSPGKTANAGTTLSDVAWQLKDHLLPTRGAAGPVVDWGKYSRVILRWQQVLGRMVPHPLMAGSKGNAVLSPVFVEWMMGLPEGWVTGCGLIRNAQLKILGNGVVPHQAVLGLRVLLARVPDEVIAWLSATS